MRVALVLNTRKDESEFEVEYDPPHTVEMIKHGIESAGHDYIFIEADENILETLKQVKPDLVFNRSEGVRGESRESHIPAILEMLGIPYVGANVLSTAVCLNKGWTKKFLAFHNVVTPQFHILSSTRQVNKLDFIFPVILKPNEEGSSVGINEDNVVSDKKQLVKKLGSMVKEYQQPILVEQFIQGREFSVGVLDCLGPKPHVLALLEIDFSRFPSEVGGVYGQKAKTIYEGLDHYICPAKVRSDLKKKIGQVSIEICRLLEVPDFARIDYRMDDNEEIYFLEINPLPGMDFDPDNQDISFYPYMAEKSGYTYDQLIQRLIESAARRYGLNK
ncbi:MAG: ATP-grasp domain-containing protein [Candidatus Thorarchaeota archaeon]|nr:ATP-grasp domain-containing protein [Candidatus Thorarchaeota archaeon]